MDTILNILGKREYDAGIFDVDFVVIFPNGDIIAEKTAIKTFIKTIEKIGIERIKELRLIARKNDNTPLISEYRDPDKSKQEKVGEYYVWKNLQNAGKEKYLKDISDRLNLDLKIVCR